MYSIVFYRDKDGKEPVVDYIEELSSRRDKDSRLKRNKILKYLDILSTYGTSSGEPYVKHIEGEIWELRPLRDRIFFAAWIENSFVILHYFVKKTQKTPHREIEQAKRELKEFRERELCHEE